MASRAIGNHSELGEVLRKFTPKIKVPNFLKKQRDPLDHHANIFPGFVVTDYIQDDDLGSSWLPLLPDPNLDPRDKPGQFNFATIIGVECSNVDRSIRAIQDEGHLTERLIGGIAIGKEAVDMVVPVGKFARLTTCEGTIATVAVGQTPNDDMSAVTVGLLDHDGTLFQIPDAYILEQNVPTDEIKSRFGSTPLV